MEPGAFSVSLAFSDIAASRALHEKLGFTAFGGEPGQQGPIPRNGSTLVGLFHGMFEKSLLTFNPGWHSDAQPLPALTDVRDILRRLMALGFAPNPQAGPARAGR